MTPSTKRCAICKRTQPLNEFNRRALSRDGLQRHCRECNRVASKAYYRRDRRGHQADVRENSRRYRARNRALLVEYLREHPCVDCGEIDVLVLEFDHVRGQKVMGVFLLAARALKVERVMSELAKCEVRCVNCHLKRSGDTGGWWRSRGADRRKY